MFKKFKKVILTSMQKKYKRKHIEQQRAKS